MTTDRRKEIVWHLSEAEIDDRLAAAEDAETLRRMAFLKNLARGDTVRAAAERVGRSESTGDRWASAWNAGGLAGLMPDYGGGRPPKLDRERLAAFLSETSVDTVYEARRRVHEEFGVEYHPDYLRTLLAELGVSLADRA
jgi:transposase